MKLLLIEDNKELAHDIRQFLSNAGIVVEWVGNLKDALDKVFVYQYDIAIIDLGLPDGNGLELIREIKKTELDIGILILTAKNSIDDKVEGLNLGADDYMTKPFHKAELNARIHSIIRKNKSNRSNILSIGDINVELLSRKTSMKETQLKLTKKEFDLLVYFMHNPNRILTKENIAEYLWGDHIDQADSFDFVYNHIKNLRKKIVDAGGINCIHAMYGMGYKFVTDDEEGESA